MTRASIIGVSRDLEQAAALLDADPNYRVTRALPPLSTLPLPEPKGWVRNALVIDTETTSLDWRTGKIIQVAACPIRFDQKARVVGIDGTQSWLEDPGEALTAEISKLTGLTDAELSGRRIDIHAVTQLLEQADVVIAHNAEFDRPWWEARFPVARTKRWACSMREVDWRNHGYESRMLGILLDRAASWFNRRHRADADVDALVALLTATLPPGHSVAAELLLTASKPKVRISATRAPFAVKDRLRDRGYRWHPRERVWQVVVDPSNADSEIAWLATEADCFSPVREDMTWLNRHR